MKTLNHKINLSLLFLIVNIMNLTAQNNFINSNSNQKNISTTIETSPTPILSDNQVSIAIEEPDATSKGKMVKKTVTGIVSLQINNITYKGMSYQLFDKSGKLITSKTINNANTTIPLHNAEAENYVLNIVKGNENLKTFGFYH